MAKPKVRILLLDSYLAAIRSSIGTKMFQTLFADVNGKRRDITNQGELSCAVYVSALLLFFGLIKERHATVAGTLKDMKSSGWRKVRALRPGAVLHGAAKVRQRNTRTHRFLHRWRQGCLEQL